jgi:hypothetical protein
MAGEQAVSVDRDLLAAMPEPPPPRPDRRKLAIEEALRRFDGGEAQKPPGIPVRTPVRALFGRPQVAAFATVLLVALVGIPVWMSGQRPDLRHPVEPPSAASSIEVPLPAAAPVAPSPLVPVPPPSELAAPPASPVMEPGIESPAPANALAPVAASPRSPDVQLADAPQPQMKAAPSAGITADRLASRAQGFAAAPPLPPPPPPAAVSDEASDQVVVTGSRAAPAASFGRIDASNRSVIEHNPPTDDAWNACTVLDPRRNLRACRGVIDPGAPGPAGRAAAHSSDGLTSAWQGDLDRAIDAFGRAIAAAPNYSFAYLNRGLAWQRKGDDDRALADFNAAIARDPDSASAYYHRSLLLRARGETGRADADARRARQLDPHNAGILKQP